MDVCALRVCPVPISSLGTGLQMAVYHQALELNTGFQEQQVLLTTHH